MGMNQTPASERVHISFFGKRNAGKSSVINAVTGQDLASVSSVMGTTTDPVYKTMELLPLGPVMVIDTPGMREMGVESADLSRSFADIEELALQCRFRDCTHTGEPGCAVAQALETGSLDRARWQS